jgi:hypothetical protein
MKYIDLVADVGSEDDSIDDEDDPGGIDDRGSSDKAVSDGDFEISSVGVESVFVPARLTKDVFKEDEDENEDEVDVVTPTASEEVPAIEERSCDDDDEYLGTDVDEETSSDELILVSSGIRSLLICVFIWQCT